MYEIMYIINPDIEGEAQDEAIARVNEVLEKEGGSVELVKKIGKRRLAYEINDYKEGFYVLLNVQARPSVVPALDHFFKVSEGYLRHLVIRQDEGRKREKEKEKPEEPKKTDAGSVQAAAVEE